MTILEEAAKLSGENRQRDYGHPLVNHERIAAIWNVILGPQLTKPITPEQVVWCMIGTKIAREVNTPKRDNIVDVVGYANCLDLIQVERGKPNPPLEISRPIIPQPSNRGYP